MFDNLIYEGIFRTKARPTVVNDFGKVKYTWHGTKSHIRPTVAALAGAGAYTANRLRKDYNQEDSKKNDSGNSSSTPKVAPRIQVYGYERRTYEGYNEDINDPYITEGIFTTGGRKARTKITKSFFGKKHIQHWDAQKAHVRPTVATIGGAVAASKLYDPVKKAYNDHKENQESNINESLTLNDFIDRIY